MSGLPANDTAVDLRTFREVTSHGVIFRAEVQDLPGFALVLRRPLLDSRLCFLALFALLLSSLLEYGVLRFLQNDRVVNKELRDESRCQLLAAKALSDDLHIHLQPFDFISLDRGVVLLVVRQLPRRQAQ